LRHPAHLKLGGVECEASVLFVDIRGFSAMAQRQSPSAVLGELNQFFAAIVPVIDACGGLVLEYTGDGLLALFGAPQRLENHAQAAVDAAIGIVHASRRMSAERRGEGGRPLRIGCGINSGPVVCGNLGWAQRSQFAAIGDTTNVAARLEELNKAPLLNDEFPSEIVISEATFTQLTTAPPVRGPFPVEIRGRQGQMRIYQVRVSNE
jgi:class 3 adenylate cyclase